MRAEVTDLLSAKRKHGRGSACWRCSFLEQSLIRDHPSLAAIRSSGNGAPKAVHVLATLSDQIDMAKSGVGIEHFGPTHLKRMVICLPPSEEQSAIIHKVRSETKHLNQAITRAEREIGLIREYRTRLLADVVTGQLDVRAAAAKLPEEPAELERLDEVDTVAEADDTADDDRIDTEPAEVET